MLDLQLAVKAVQYWLLRHPRECAERQRMQKLLNQLRLAAAIE